MTSLEIADAIVVSWMAERQSLGQLEGLSRLAQSIADALETQAMRLRAPEAERAVPTGVPVVHYPYPENGEIGAFAQAPKSSPSKAPTKAKPACSASGCTRPAFCKGMCSTHYERKRKGIPVDAPLRKAPVKMASDLEAMIAGFCRDEHAAAGTSREGRGRAARQREPQRREDHLRRQAAAR